METLVAASPTWPLHLSDALDRLGSSPRCPRAQALAWRLLHGALFAALRGQAGRIAPVSLEDLEDIASAKALELLRRAESGEWRVAGRASLEIVGFIRRVARNGLVDLARRRGRECPPPEDGERWDVMLHEASARDEDTTDLAATREFVRALRDCVAALAPRARAVWFRSAVLERPSRETAAALRLQVGHVDVLAQRARRSLVDCMGGKGHRTSDVAPRAFVLLWSESDPASWLGASSGNGDHEH
jgi:RNA polymerase sigma factor (sigma-70 family)